MMLQPLQLWVQSKVNHYVWTQVNYGYIYIIMSSSDMLTAIQYNEIMNQVPATINLK